MSSWKGSADLDVDGESGHAETWTAIKVGPATKPEVGAGSSGARILALGAVPGGVYSPPAFTDLGGPEPVPPKQST